MLLQLRHYQYCSDLEAVIFTQLHVLITESPCHDNSCNGCANRLLILAEYNYNRDGPVSTHVRERNDGMSTDVCETVDVRVIPSRRCGLLLNEMRDPPT